MGVVDDFLSGLFAFLGPAGALIVLFFVFVLDAALFPALPEVAIVLTYSYIPAGFDPGSWAVVLVAIAVAGEATGNTALYVFVSRALIRRGHMPRTLERFMQRWIQFLVVRDEKVILLNRVAPVVPLVGAFIAACRWDYRRSLAYIVGGAAAKYVVLLVLVGWVGIAYDPATARWVTVGLVLGIVAVSLGLSVLYRRRVGVPPRDP